ncbi:MAG: GNAT family N-acetyltransferase [Deltaproteobacteria bacterium]|nr:GNAT family N-acetyltransferase [Deltaproteobacteria bacterium]
MSVSQLEKLFNPQVIAVAGNRDADQDLKFTELVDNLRRTALPRTIYIIGNVKEREPDGIEYRKSLDEIREEIDLLFLTCPLHELPLYFTTATLKRTAAIAILKNITSSRDRAVLEEIMEAARTSSTRIIGVNSSGILCPPIRLNLSTHPQLPPAGKIAFFSQSGAVLGTILDLARELDIGFSHIASIGSLLDIDFGDLIDFVGDDPEVDAIMLYLENIRNVKKFISACRSVSRIKPIIAIKSGRHPRIHEIMRRRVFSQIGAGPVYDSAFRRAGIISVDNLKEMLLAGRSLSRRNIPNGDRLGIITNSGGLAIFTVDHLLFNEVEPTPLSKKLLARLRQILPKKLVQNPIDVGGTTDTETFSAAIAACLEAEEFDALIILAAAHQTLDPRLLIRQVQKKLEHHYCAVTYTWINANPRDRRIAAPLAHQGIYVYFSVPAALNAYLYSRRYRHKLNQLTAVAPRFHREYSLQHLNPREFLEPCLDNEIKKLPQGPAQQLLQAYGLNLSAPSAPALNEGLALRAGSATDIEFGPYLFLAMAGIAGEIQPEKSIMLPPLNPFLARVMIARSPAVRALKRRSAELNEDLAIILLRLASIVTDCPEIVTLELRLRETARQSFRLDHAVIEIKRSNIQAPHHLVIAPYPNEYEFHDQLRDGRNIFIRPIRPEDEDLHHELFNSLSRETNYFRFFSFRRHLSHELAARFTQIDYDREMAIIALIEENNRQRSIGVNRLSYQPRRDQHEFAIVVADAYQGSGVGSILMRRLIEIARDRRIKQIFGVVLAENSRMIDFCLAFGFVVESQENNTITFRLDLE